MYEDFIADMASAFREQMESVKHFPSGEKYKAQLRDDISAMAMIIHKHFPLYPIDLFYVNCGWEGTIPHHVNQKRRMIFGVWQPNDHQMKILFGESNG